MKLKKIKLLSCKNFLVLICGFILIFSCKENEKKEQTSLKAVPVPIELSLFTTSLPDDAGVEVTQSNCLICHSAQYILMQPEFPRKSWEKIVDKMIKNYGAPVSDSTTRADIVQYLMNIRGKK